MSTYVGDTTEVGPNCSVGAKSRVGRESKLTNSKLGPNCAVGDGAIIINSIISGSLNAGRGLRLTKANVSSSVRLGNEFVSKTDLTLRDGVVFGDHALVGANVRVAPGVRAGEYCAIEDGVTIDDGVAIGPYVELGSRTRVDVGAVLLADTIVGEGAYIGPYIEAAGTIAAGSYLAYRQQPIPVWPIPRRTFDDSTKKQG
jgi:NDP-sugar pyrophosphorylase family protein